MPEKLEEYKKKRDFEKTSEPFGEVSSEFYKVVRKMFSIPKARPIYVVQEHKARRLHYDLRLELDGVLKSWAVPKGIPTEKDVKHLAVRTEDHPLEYASFAGKIPKGLYGAGNVKIWDRGTFELWKREEKLIKFWIKGKKIKGEYVLIKLAPRPQFPGKNNWLLFKRLDWSERKEELQRLAKKEKKSVQEILESFEQK